MPPGQHRYSPRDPGPLCESALHFYTLLNMPSSSTDVSACEVPHGPSSGRLHKSAGGKGQTRRWYGPRGPAKAAKTNGLGHPSLPAKYEVGRHLREPADRQPTRNMHLYVLTFEQVAALAVDGQYTHPPSRHFLLAFDSNPPPPGFPNHAVWRFKAAVRSHDMDRLLQAVQSVEEVSGSSREPVYPQTPGIKPTKSATHNVHQYWLGVWAKYSSVPFLSANSRPKQDKASDAVTNLQRTYDSVTGKLINYIMKVDPVTGRSMKYSHRSTAEALGVIKDGFDEGQLNSKATNSFRTTASALGETGPTNTRVRYGSAGTVLAVSRGEVADYHVDKGDHTRHPSVIFCNKPAILYVKVAGVELRVELAAGDAVGLVACAYQHKFVRDPEDKSEGQFYVFTAWTERSIVEKVADYGKLYGIENRFAV